MLTVNIIRHSLRYANVTASKIIVIPDVIIMHKIRCITTKVPRTMVWCFYQELFDHYTRHWAH